MGKKAIFFKTGR